MHKRGRADVPEIFFRIRRCNRSRAAFRLNVAIKLLDGFAFLATDLFAGVTNTFALVRLRRIETTNVRCDLPYDFLVRALNHDFGLISDGDFDVLWNREQNRVRKPEAEIQVRALHGSLEANALDFELFRKTFAYADDHVMHESARESVQRFHASRFRAARDRDVIVFHAARDLPWQFPIQLALRAFDRNAAVIVDVDFDFIGNVDRFVSNSRHKIYQT